MIWSSGLAKRGHVTTHAFGGEAEPIELTDRADFVAGIAVHCCVGANQGKAVLVFIDVMDRDLPSVGIVAEGALSAILAAMQICVAILTLFWSVAEDEILVAIDALCLSVPAAQRKPGLRMIEGRLGA